jgi:hypothetical protein
MEENETKQEAKPVAEDSKEKAVNPIEEAKAILQKIEEANAKTAELVRRQEELQARDILAGRSHAESPVVKQEETPKEYAARVLAGKV